MKHSQILLIVAVVAIVGSRPSTAQTVVQPTTNAALKYWQAFGALPQLNDNLADKLRQVWNPETYSKPVGANLKRQLETAKYSLTMLHRAASIEQCDWGVNMRDEGAETLLPHLHDARRLSLLAMLRARLRFEAGDTTGAVEDLVATATLGRHITRDGTLIGFLMGYQIETRAYDVLCGWLPQLNSEGMEQLTKSLAELPWQPSLQENLASEEQFLDWAIELVESNRPGSLLRLCRALATSDEQTESLLQVGGRRADFARQLHAIRPLYREANRIVELDPDEFATKHALYTQRLEQHPLAKFCTANLQSLNDVVHKNQARLALMRAAIDVQQLGRDALAEHPDPYGDAPFEYAEHSEGFTLTSAYQSPNGDEVILTVGVSD